ncbi:MAG TPA: helix-turn-helix domain-containing protein [Gemmataceae bacterium]|nr:helix-turn-helix domain-containing protein [Gemmataceae bacterium]
MDALARFVPLAENRSAHRAVEQLASAIGQGTEFPLLVLHGPPGSGKSHLAAGLIERVTQTHPTATAQTVAAAEFGRSLLQKPQDRQPVLREAIAVDLLVLEDVQHLPPAAGDDVAYVLDQRQARRKATVVTSSCGPAELDASPRLASRLVGGLVVGIQPLSEPSRRELATRLCAERGLNVAYDVLGWLARDPGGVRPILGGIARLEALAKLHPPPLTLAVVMAEAPDPESDDSALDRLVTRVAGRFRVPAKALRGRSRERHVVWPRQLAMYVARHAGYSLPAIGAYFGGRDHTTVMHSCDKVARAAADDSRLAQELRDFHAAMSVADSARSDRGAS